MNQLNSVLIEGTVVGGLLLRYAPKDHTPVCAFRISHKRSYRGGPVIESYFDVEAWGTLAESCKVSGHDGRGVRVVGMLKQVLWTGADGKPHEKISIIVEHIEWMPSPGSTRGKKRGKNKEA
jgi:single-strand DNA-binding protein